MCKIRLPVNIVLEIVLINYSFPSVSIVGSGQELPVCKHIKSRIVNILKSIGSYFQKLLFKAFDLSAAVLVKKSVPYVI